MDKFDIETYNAIEDATLVFKTEAAELVALSKFMGDDFNAAVRTIIGCTGRVVLSGVGKSGNVAKNMSLSFSNIGLNSYYLDPSKFNQEISH